MNKFLKFAVSALLAAAIPAFATNNVLTTPYSFTAAQTTTFLNTPTVSSVLTAAGNASGTTTAYTGTFVVANIPIGSTVTIAGFVTNTVNNGSFVVTAVTTTTLTVLNSAGVAETHAGTAVSSVEVPQTGPIFLSKFVWISPTLNTSFIVTDGTGETIAFHTASSGDVSKGYYLFNANSATVSDFQVTLLGSGTLYIYTTPTLDGGTITTNGTAVAAGVCQAQPTLTVAGTTTASIAAWSIGNAPVATWQTGITVLPVAFSNEVILYLCNPTAGSITPAAQVVNIRVVN
jgi:hypothetical protein